MKDATFTDADFAGADLRGVQNLPRDALTPKQWKAAITTDRIYDAGNRRLAAELTKRAMDAAREGDTYESGSLRELFELVTHCRGNRAVMELAQADCIREDADMDARLRAVVLLTTLSQPSRLARLQAEVLRRVRLIAVR